MTADIRQLRPQQQSSKIVRYHIEVIEYRDGSLETQVHNMSDDPASRSYAITMLNDAIAMLDPDDDTGEIA